MAFVDRVVQYPNRYLLEDGGGVQTGPYTLIRDEGTITESGTALTASNLNAEIAAAINNALAAFTIDGNLNVTYKNLQSGRTTTTVASKTTKSITVTFSQAFDNVPNIIVTPISSDPTQVRVSTSGISTTGFTLNIYATVARTCNIDWLAVAQ